MNRFAIGITLGALLFSSVGIDAKDKNKHSRGIIIEDTQEDSEFEREMEIIDSLRNAEHETDSAAILAAQNIQDSAILMPESMTSELDTLLSGWLNRYYVHTDDNCISDSDVPPVPDSVYVARLKALPCIIDMPYNQIVRSYIDMYVHKRRTQVEYMVGLGEFYFPMFEDILTRYNVPLELKYLPVIESALRPAATSRVGAAGLWQFMPSTGKLMGLEINTVLDERRDPEKSTAAACRYLTQLHDMYGNWTLAIAAYNCGPGNVNKAIKRSGGKMDFWELYFYLPRETRGYIPAFIAANYIMNYHCEHNLCAVQTEIPPATDTVMVDRMVHFKQISVLLNIPVEQIRQLNPQYGYDIVPGNYKKSALRLPADKLYEYIAQEDSIMNYNSDSLLPKNGNITDIIKKGSLGGKYAAGTSHVVRKGQTLSIIARRYGTSVSKIKKLNGLKNDRLHIGQRLRVK